MISSISLISIVFQDNVLFSGTIRENILLGRRNASQEDLHEAVRSACLDEFIQSLPQGLDTEIGERGVLLSGSRKQRVAIARTFIKKSPIVILDEATSALDNKSEAIVQQAIENLMQNRTVLTIAHRLTTVIHADFENSPFFQFVPTVNPLSLGWGRIASRRVTVEEDTAHV